MTRSTYVRACRRARIAPAPDAMIAYLGRRGMLDDDFAPSVARSGGARARAIRASWDVDRARWARIKAAHKR